MFTYYLMLALRSLKGNVVLTVLMISAIGVGIGASMTTLTIFRAMDADPIPEKSTQLFAPQIDNWGPQNKRVVTGDEEHLQDQISYTDAVNLMSAHAAPRQAAMYATRSALTPANRDLLPFRVETRATYTDFFKMFDVPFLYGGPWSAADDADRGYVAVITRELNDRVFNGANSRPTPKPCTTPEAMIGAEVIDRSKWAICQSANTASTGTATVNPAYCAQPPVTTWRPRPLTQ